MTLPDIWHLLRGIGRRREGESLADWSFRLLGLVPPPPPPTPEEWRSIRAIPLCPYCGADVIVTERGRLDVTHDYRLHHPERRTPAVRAPERGGYSTVRDAMRSVTAPLFGDRT